jgi:hypothetical protein
MSISKKAKEPFVFYTRLHLSELTGRKASNLKQLVDIMRTMPESSIYHHTHRFLQQHQYLSPEPPNDFAYWVTTVLGEERLGEKLASIDTVQFTTIHELQNKIISTIETYLKSNPNAANRFVHENEEFHFMKSVSFILPTQYAATDLVEFVEILKKIDIDSIYFHIFEARLRLGKKTNDFSNWIETSLGDKELADKILKLDPYTYTLEDLRKTIIRIIEKSLSK